MKKIKLTQGQFALVDDADYDWLNQWKWFAYKHRHGNFYAARMSSTKNGKRFCIRMSRKVLGLKQGDKQQADHIYHNTLDNRRDKLRVCTNQENTRNKKIRSNTTSQFKGVHWCKLRKKWVAKIMIDGIKKSLGNFILEMDAALAYNKAAEKYFGEYACLNLI